SLAAFVAIEQRREYLARQRRRHEEIVGRQPLQNLVAQLLGKRMLLGQLPVALDLGRLVAGGGAAVYPVGLLQATAHLRRFLGAENFCNVYKHDKPASRTARITPDRPIAPGRSRATGPPGL